MYQIDKEYWFRSYAQREVFANLGPFNKKLVNEIGDQYFRVLALSGTGAITRIFLTESGRYIEAGKGRFEDGSVLISVSENVFLDLKSEEDYTLPTFDDTVIPTIKHIVVENMLVVQVTESYEDAAKNAVERKLKKPDAEIEIFASVGTAQMGVTIV